MRIRVLIDMFAIKAVIIILKSFNRYVYDGNIIQRFLKPRLNQFLAPLTHSNGFDLIAVRFQNKNLKVS